MDVLRHMKADAALATVRALVLTSSLLPTDAAEARRAGAAAYLTKPVDVAVLFAVVAELAGPNKELRS